MHENLESNFLVFTADGTDAVGSVRDIRRSSSELVIYIENAGDFVVPFSAIEAVHSGKVILGHDHLAKDLREAIAHARDSEYPH
ncbi:MAG TPA: hypothetical protein VGO76_13745 [Luteibacter sp.]|jgi:hypothetical protein|nr:hypothetical protein [Luteibacter sp.]